MFTFADAKIALFAARTRAFRWTCSRRCPPPLPACSSRCRRQQTFAALTSGLSRRAAL